MRLEEVYVSISGELEQVRMELKNIEKDIGYSSAREVFEHFFKVPGKLLRPSLMLMSAGAVNQTGFSAENKFLVQLATAVELIHNASLIHDDVIDDDLFRRGHKTLNNAFGNKIAVIAGDALFSRAFSILSSLLSKDLFMQVVQTVKAMSLSEIQQIVHTEGLGGRESYFEMIRRKTALLMSISCRLGAALVVKEKGLVEGSAEYGLNFGMMYQIVDDFIDEDPAAVKYAELKDVKAFAAKARDSIRSFEASIHKEKLEALVEYVLSSTHYKAEKSVNENCV